MKITFSNLKLAVLVTSTIVFIISTGQARASSPDSVPSENCTTVSDREKGLRYEPAHNSAAILHFALLEIKDSSLTIGDTRILEGNCAKYVYAFRVPNLAFEDGDVFWGKSNGNFVYLPNQKGLSNFWNGSPSSTHPKIKNARFIMASKVDGAFSSRSMDVGLWKVKDGYLIAAFVVGEGEVSEPVELIRSRYTVRSVTFFPAPDSNNGTLGLVAESNGKTILFNINWDHSTLSKTLRSEK